MERGSLPIVLLVASLLLGGCWGDKYDYIDCDCPLSEDFVALIDWMGNGTAPDSLSSYSDDGDGFVHVNVTYSSFRDFDEAAASYERLLVRLDKDGIELGQLRFGSREFELSLTPPFADDPNGWRIRIGVRTHATDAEAIEIFAPLAAALGVRG